MVVKRMCCSELVPQRPNGQRSAEALHGEGIDRSVLVSKCHRSCQASEAQRLGWNALSGRLTLVVRCIMLYTRAVVRLQATALQLTYQRCSFKNTVKSRSPGE